MSCDIEGRLNVRCNNKLDNRLGPLKAQWLLYVPTGLTTTNSTLCPHSVFMCFVWISEKQQLFRYTAMTGLIWFGNRDGKCSLRGTSSILTYSWSQL